MTDLLEVTISPEIVVIIEERPSEAIIMTDPEISTVVTTVEEIVVSVETPGVGQVVVIAATGLQGPAGVAGASGSGYSHIQTASSSVWLVNHNLGLRPSVTAFNPGGVEIEGSVLHLSDNTLTITFAIPITGYARIV